ncbi:MAG: hypothetical protein IJT11_03025 [Bacteroidaceae bacterium]|nr:hypothetical protein [Bacteroidaceae bacterium]
MAISPTIYKPGETHVTMWGGHVIRDVFGGGRGFNNWKTEDKTEGNTNGYVFGKTDVNIHLGIIGTPDGLEKGYGNVFGGGNAAPVPATNVTVNGSYEIEYVFGGGNGADRIYKNDTWQENPGADVGLKADGTSYGTGDLIGTAVTNILGGVVHLVFGGSNTKGDITKSASVVLGDQDLDVCQFTIGEVYGAGNEAYMSGNASITLNCIEGLEEIYGGSRRANISGDVVLNISGGRFKRVFGGNNESGNISGSITVNVKETGCLPIIIDELYGGGNQAHYSVYGYNPDGSCKESGTAQYADPQVNVISATRIGAIYGGGLGATAVVYGNPYVNINMEKGKVNGNYEYKDGVSPSGYDVYENPMTLDLGNIGTVFGGGNAAKVVGKTYVQIGTGKDTAGADVFQTDDATKPRQEAQIEGNVFGGGNQADVTGETNVVVGKEN